MKSNKNGKKYREKTDDSSAIETNGFDHQAVVELNGVDSQAMISSEKLDKSRNYSPMLRKRSALAETHRLRQHQDVQYTEFEESNGLKKRGKTKKKRALKDVMSINLHKRSRKQEFPTRDPNEERGDTGPQLLLEDKFSDNTFEKVIKEQLKSIQDKTYNYDPSLPKPTAEYTELLINMLDSIELVKTIISNSNESIRRYNHRLAQSFQRQAEELKNDSRSSHPTDEPSQTGNKSVSSATGKEIGDKDNTEGIEESLESQIMERTLYQQAKIEQDLKDSYSYINCDVRYFNFEYLTSKLGYFDVLLVDPPWRIKGGQKNDSQYMFSNSSFCLEYNTMSNSEIMNLPLEKLSNKGFIFLWILANQIDSSVSILEKWGYALVDLIMWVKIKDRKIWLSHGYYLMHSYEVCLVGYKCPPKEHVEFFSKISNNIIFAEVRSKSQKPDELYELIELMMPGSKKVEIFARNNNVRPGWFAIGNQLGPQFGKWRNLVHCDRCSKPLDAASKCRHKSKKTPNYDLCTDCFGKDSQLQTDDFFKLNTQIQEDILHYYRTCNLCKTEPIWGVRFTRKDEPDFDLCEACYDLDLSNNQEGSLVLKYDFEAIEVPELAGGLPTHKKKCSNCYQYPIIGTCFQCSECKSLFLCQNCFFSENSLTHVYKRTHKPEHQFEMYLHQPLEQKEEYTCSWCEQSMTTAYKCENCHSFYFCEICYAKKGYWQPLRQSTSHKAYHSNFMKLN